MNRVKYLIFFMFILCLGLSCVKARCDTEFYPYIDKDISKIKVTYSHLGKIQLENGNYTYDKFNVKFNDLEDYMYIKLNSTNKEWHLEDKSNEINIELSTGFYYFDVYSLYCDERLTVIKVKLPKFNVYSLDPLCKDIDSNEFTLCSKYYDEKIDKKTFENKVKEYQKKMKNNDNFDINRIIDMILYFIVQYKIYLIIGLCSIILFLIIIIIFKRKYKRGVLE